MRISTGWAIVIGLTVAAIVIIVLVTRDGNSDAQLARIAEDACAELEGAIVLQAGGIVSRAVNEAEREGFTGVQLGDRMRKECPALMAALEGIADEQEEREALPSKMSVTDLSCGSDEARGRVTNNSAVTVDVFIDVQFLDDDGIVVDDSLGTLNGLRPGETGEWDAPYLGRGSYDRCRADVSSAFEQ